jgi:hypothetical protein
VLFHSCVSYLHDDPLHRSHKPWRDGERDS